MKKATDLLDFYRRTHDRIPDSITTEDLERGPRLMLIRRTQIVVAGVAAGLVVVLAFLFGMAMGGDEAEPETVAESLGITASWVIRVASYSDTKAGRANAKFLMSQLERMDLEDVSLHRIPSQNVLVVALGSWAKKPVRGGPVELLDTVRNLPDHRDNSKPFASADMWQIK
ncbi:MAG: hypothetical protein OER88_00840 [Planctomycetota bacterium]|nr:hypothetical protein [Planctomycetota bacterium]